MYLIIVHLYIYYTYVYQCSEKVDKLLNIVYNNVIEALLSKHTTNLQIIIIYLYLY